MSIRQSITALLHNRGSQSAAEALMPLLYDDLRAIAGKIVAGRGAVAVSPTTLVHEAYERLVDQKYDSCSNRSHFCAIASIVIRRVFVDLLRQQHALRRGGGAAHTTLTTRHLTAEKTDVDVMALHEAIESLAADEPRAARLVELRFFGGLSMAEAATELGVSVPTAERDWRFGRAWLLRALS